MNLWVFRLSRGWGGGSPAGHCPNNIDRNRLARTLANISQSPINYDHAIDFLISELFDEGNLRQGWGLPDLNLNLNEDDWAVNYMIDSYQYWDTEATCSDAIGRRNILISMLEMQVGDIIFVPNFRPSRIDETTFTVVTVAETYQFQNRSHLPLPDFGHIIPIDKLKTRYFWFSNRALPKDLFGAPYMKAVAQVTPTHQSYERFHHFLGKYY